MANKTNPIGVRFRQDVLDMLKTNHGVDSPQKALVFMERFYVQNHKIALNVTNYLRDFPMPHVETPPQTQYDAPPLPANFQGDEPLSFERLAAKEAVKVNLYGEYEQRILQTRNIDEIKALVVEIEKNPDLVWLEKKKLKDLAIECSKTMYNE